MPGNGKNINHEKVTLCRRKGFRRLFLLIALIVISLIYYTADVLFPIYSDIKIPWEMDPEYSFMLTANPKGYDHISSGHGTLLDTVDAVRIYRIKGRRADRLMTTMAKLFRRELVFETKEKEFIERFIEATQAFSEDVPICMRQYDNEALHVVALDNTFMRAGYFVLTACEKGANDYFRIQPLHVSDSVYSNRALYRLLKEELHIEIEKKKS